MEDHADDETKLEEKTLGKIHMEGDVRGMADSDWGGDGGRSTSGGLITWSGCLLSSWSRTQASSALSSAEAELYAMCAAAVESRFIAQLGRELGIDF